MVDLNYEGEEASHVASASYLEAPHQHQTPVFWLVGIKEKGSMDQNLQSCYGAGPS